MQAMIILDKPFVSNFLIETIKRLEIPVINTKTAVQFLDPEDHFFISETDAVQLLKNGSSPLLYTNSENAVNWIEENVPRSVLSQKVSLFKNKVLLRNLLKDIYPGYFFKEISFNDLKEKNFPSLRFPLIIKPAVGFFSIGVQQVDSEAELENAVKMIEEDVKEFNNVYPEEVLATDSFIIEEYINGEEYAVDVYYNDTGSPVILNIMKHLFASDDDVGDRVYMSSKDIVESNKNNIRSFLKEVGKRAELKNFPAHVELRINKKGKINPVEINPLRFGAWCTTADFAGIALKTNTYENYWKQKEPDWDAVFKGKENTVFSMIVLDNSTGFSSDQIQSFDHGKLRQRFKKSKILEYRETDYKKYKVFGFLFTETNKEDIEELYGILNSDLKEYISI